MSIKNKQKKIISNEKIQKEIEYDYEKNDEVVLPFKDEILTTQIVLFPHQLNNNLYMNLKNNLIEKVEGKCLKEGYINKVYKILEYDNGYIEPENFAGYVLYNIKYLAQICYAIKDIIIVCKINSYLPTTNFILSNFGNPAIIKVIFTKSVKDINVKKFKIDTDLNIYHIDTRKNLANDDYIKIQLKIVRYYLGSNIINAIGYLLDIATNEEIEKFGYQSLNKINDNGDNKKIIKNIYLNEAEDIEDININKEKINYNINI